VADSDEWATMTFCESRTNIRAGKARDVFNRLKAVWVKENECFFESYYQEGLLVHF
jgi:hypothetical protein